MNGKMRANQRPNLYPVDRHDCMRHITLMVIETARLDALGHIESSSYAKKGGLRAETITDAKSFFLGPRYKHYATHLDIASGILPLDIPELLEGEDFNNYDDDRFGKLLAVRQVQQQRRTVNARRKRKLKESLERKARKLALESNGETQ